MTLGDNLIAPLPDNNEKGFFEDAEVNALDEELLHAIGHSWHSVALAADELASPALDSFAERAGRLLDQRLASATRFGIKDPRMCRLLPFWQRVFATRRVEVDYLIACRNPLEVSSSLARRDRFLPDKCHCLWLEHQWAALVYTAGSRRLVVDYGNLMRDADRELSRVAARFGLDFDPDSPQAREYREGFLDASLHHARFETPARVAEAVLPHLVVDLYGMLGQFATDQLDPDGEVAGERIAAIGRRMLDAWPALACAHAAERQAALTERALREADVVAARASRAVASLHANVDSLHREVAVRDAKIVELHHAVAQRDAAAETLRAELIPHERNQSAESAGDAGSATLLAEAKARIGILEREVASLGSEAQALRQALDEHEGAMAELGKAGLANESALNSMREAMAARERLIEAQQRDLSGLAIVLASKDERLAELERQLAERSDHAQTLESAIAGLEAGRAMLARTLRENEATMVSQPVHPTRLAATVEELRRLAARVEEESRFRLDRNSELESLSGELRASLGVALRRCADLEWGAAALRQQVRDWTDRAGILAFDLEAREHAMRDMQASRSWRLTRPLRSLRRRLGTRSAVAATGETAPVRTEMPGQGNADGPKAASFHGAAAAQVAAITAQQPQLLGYASATGVVPARRDALPVPRPVSLICLYETSMGSTDADWRVAESAQPRFPGHDQPRLPGELGRYRADDASLLQRQIALAKQYGISGFAFQFRWNGAGLSDDGRLRQILQARLPEFTFCVGWRDAVADGAPVPPADDPRLFDQLAPYLRHLDYLRFRGAPLLLIHRPGDFTPDRLRAWREALRERHCGEVCIAACTEAPDKPAPSGFDALFELPPHGAILPTVPVGEAPACANADLRDWRVLVSRSAAYDAPPSADAVVFRGVCTDWDDSAVAEARATILCGATPSGYQEWLCNAIEDTVARFPERDDRLVFVNAWNDWPRCAYLEPDSVAGHARLEATAVALVRKSAADENTSPGPLESLAVVVHAYYPEVFLGLADRLDALSHGALRLYVTSTEEGADQVRARLARGRHPYRLFPLANRGRDILPFLETLPHVVAAGHRLVLKIHTKQSRHRDDGARWRDDLISGLLNDEAVGAALARFRNDPAAGILCPPGHRLPMTDHWTENAARLAPLSERLGVRQAALRRLHFAAGSMFFARTRVFEPLLWLALSGSDFEAESGQVDGTLAHAIERAFAASAHAAGLTVEALALAVDQRAPAMAASRS